MAKFKLYVDDIITYEHKGTYGSVTDITRILYNLSIMLSSDELIYIKEQAEKNENGLVLLHRFCQYIFHLRLTQYLSVGQLIFFDCEDNVDIALDIYLRFTEGEWNSISKDEFMKKFLEIREIYSEVKGTAKLSTEELL